MNTPSLSKRRYARLPVILMVLTYIVISFGCKYEQEENATPPLLHSPPKSAELNSGNGFLISPFTGDSIGFLVNSNGDTIQTGSEIPCSGVRMSGANIKPPIRILAGKPDQQPAHPNVHQLSLPLSTIPIDKSTLKRTRLGEGNRDIVLLNSSGDTMQTGVLLDITGTTVNGEPPKLVPALPPGVTDAAIADLSFLDSDHGLSSNYIMSIFQDTRGDLWFGTNGGGVCRYDGVYIRHYDVTQGLPYNQVWAILEDQYGIIWFGTNGSGVTAFDGDKFFHFGENEGLPNGSIKTMYEDENGDIWIGSAGGGVTKLQYEESNLPLAQITTYYLGEGLPARSITAIHQDQNNLMWFGTYGHGICSFDGQVLTEYDTSDGLAGNIVWSIVEDDTGNLYFSTYGGGISIFDGDSFSTIGPDEGMSVSILFKLNFDVLGNLWYATEGNGVGIFNGQTLTELTETEGLTRNIIWSLANNNAGDVLIGSIAGGVNIYNPRSFQHFGPANNIPGTFVFDIAEDSDGNIWFGTDAGAVKYDGSTMTTYTTAHGLIHNTVTEVFSDHAGNIWFGTYDGGACMFDGKYFTQFSLEQGLCERVINGISEDHEGNIWFATQSGASVFDGKTFTNYSDTTGLAGNNIYSIQPDSKGNMWLATSGRGISKYHNGKITHYTTKEGLTKNAVWGAIPDRNDVIWVATDGLGLCRFDGKTFTQYSEAQGIPNGTVWSIVEERNGSLWAATDNGLVRLNAGPDLAGDVKYSILTMHKRDGLRSLDFMANSAFIDSRQRAWWGGGKGLEMLDLNSFSAAQEPPSPTLIAVDVNGRNIDYRGEQDSVSKSISYDDVLAFENVPVNLVVPYSQNHLTFYFSAKDWYAPGKVRYSFRIKGLSPVWSIPSQEAKTEYRNLPYGNHVFQLSAIGESGEWSKPLNYSFEVSPPWWHTWWARVLYLFLVILFILGIVRWRTARLKARAEQLQDEVDRATLTIRQQKEQVEKEKERSEELLLNILPAEVAEELKIKGTSDARHFDDVTVIFTDFKGFTGLSEELSPAELVSEIDTCFRAFDEIIDKYDIEKIKTIGDAYMAACGLPVLDNENATKVVEAAIAIRNYMWMRSTQCARESKPFFEIRIGVHTGPVVAGIVGIKKFQYDIWGDTVNTANRMESTGEIGKIHISDSTYQLIKDNPRFSFVHRGPITVKGKGQMETYFVDLRRRK